MRKITFVLTVFMVIVGIFLTPVISTGEPTPLNILLTNDDGWDATGIQKLKEALEGAGHNVTLVAPVDNRSGSSTSLTIDLITVNQESANEFSVDGSPATCVGIGIELMNALPDLVVSGTNDGANLGPITPISGTVGATIYSITRGLPAVAFSTNAPVTEEDEPDDFGEHMANVAEFAVRLIDELQTRKPHKGLLPEHTALNVNYPPLAPSEISGVSFNVQGRVGFTVTYAYAPPVDIWYPVLTPPDPSEKDVPFSDTTKFDQGYITIVPIDGDYTASPGVRGKVKSKLMWLTPMP